VVFSKAPDELHGIHKRQSHDDVRGRPRGLAADDAPKRQGTETRFGVRETAEWKRHAGEMESEMLKRGMLFDVVDWSEDQTSLPFDE
jgi:hypothetical protein